MDDNLVAAGSTRQDIDLIWGAALTRYLTLVKFAGYGNVRSSGRVQTPTLALIVEKERERMAFVPEDYWVIKAAFDASATSGPTDVEGEMCFTAAYHQARIKDEASAITLLAEASSFMRA